MFLSNALLALAAAVQSPALPAPVIVYFESGKDGLNTAAQEMLNHAVEVVRQGRAQSVTLVGHTDTVGEAAANIGLSQRRANNARDYLVSKGVAASMITSQAFGESRPARKTKDGVREPINNRVEVTFGRGSGW